MAPDPCDYAFVEVDQRRRPSTADRRRSITDAGRGQRHRRHAGRRTRPATFDLSAYAGQTIGLRFRYSPTRAVAGNDAAVAERHLRRRHRHHRCGSADGAETGADGWTLDGFSSVGPGSSQALFDNFYIAGHRTYVVVRPVPEDGSVLLRLPEHPARTSWTTTRTSRVCSSRTGTRRTRTTTRSPTRATAETCTSTPTRRRSADRRRCYWRARIQVYDAPFGLSKRRLGDAAPQQRSRATSAAWPASRCSTTRRSTGTRSCRTTA